VRIFNNNEHISEEALGLHVLNDLPRSRRAPVEKHVAECIHCQNELRHIREFVTLFRTAAKTRTPENLLFAS